MTDRAFRFVRQLSPGIISAIISAIVAVLMFGLTYFVYGRSELRKLEADIKNNVAQSVLAEVTRDLTKSQIAVSELERAIKAVDAKYTEQTRKQQLEAAKAETRNKQMASELARIQSQLAKIELSTKQLQKALEIKRDEANTSLLVADFITIARPTFSVSCNGEFIYDKSYNKTNVYKASCTVENNGRYPFYITPSVENYITTSIADETIIPVFDVDEELTPYGFIQPKQKISGSINLTFKKKFVEEFNGFRNVKLIFAAETPQYIIDVLKRNINNSRDRRALVNNTKLSTSYILVVDLRKKKVR